MDEGRKLFWTAWITVWLVIVPLVGWFGLHLLRPPYSGRVLTAHPPGRDDLYEVARALEFYSFQHGRGHNYPLVQGQYVDPSALTADLPRGWDSTVPLPSGESVAADMWGRPYLVAVTGHVYELVSPGEDGELHTADDLRWRLWL